MNLGTGRIVLQNNVISESANNTTNEEDVFERYYEYDEEQLSMGSNGKRQRGDNWTYQDKELLVECVARYPVVEDRCNEKEIVIKKNNSWQLIADEIAHRGSQKNSSLRTPQKVREQWMRLKGKAKAVLRKRGINSIEDRISPAVPYKKGPTPIDYRIKEIFPQLFEAKLDDMDKHTHEPVHFTERRNSLNADISVPRTQTFEVLQQNQLNHYGMHSNNCSPEYNASTSNHGLSSEENSYSYSAIDNSLGPRGTTKRTETNVSLNYKDPKRNHTNRIDRNCQVPAKKMLKRKIAVKMNAFEHLLLQANLKKINQSVKQNEELHRIKMTIQRKESYLLDLQIKKAQMEIEAKLRCDDRNHADSEIQMASNQTQILYDHSQERSNHNSSRQLGTSHNNTIQFVSSNSSARQETTNHNDSRQLVSNHNEARLLIPNHNNYIQLTSNHNEARQLIPNHNDVRQLIPNHNDSRQLVSNHNVTRQLLSNHNEARQRVSEHNEAKQLVSNHNDVRQLIPSHNDSKQPLSNHNETRQLISNHNETSQLVSELNEARQLVLNHSDARQISQNILNSSRGHIVLNQNHLLSNQGQLNHNSGELVQIHGQLEQTQVQNENGPNTNHNNPRINNVIDMDLTNLNESQEQNLNGSRIMMQRPSLHHHHRNSS